jgi:hypothetical protein
MKLMVLALGILAVACSPPSDDDDASENELTSVTARQRELTFDGYVYVRKGARDTEIVKAVREQTQSAFGALQAMKVGVNSRELKDVDPATFKKADVTVVNAARPEETTNMVKVTYRYTDNAVVPVNMAERSALSIALLGDEYQTSGPRILKECTLNDEEAKEFKDSVWYVFNPSLASCKEAMQKEQAKIDADTAALANPGPEVALSEVQRLYLPITVSLGADKTNKGTSYPEYDRLFSGGVKPGRLVLGMVSGFIDDKPNYKDSGYQEWLQQLEQVFKGQNFELAAGDSLVVRVGSQDIPFTMQKVFGWELRDNQLPEGVEESSRERFRKLVGEQLIQRWMTFEAKKKVTIGNGPPKDFVIQLDTYFGSEGDAKPYKQAIKNSDVFFYNGHSYIGYGPLDPGRLSASNFPSSYQIMFIDSCISYNYYDKDYFPLKDGGTKNLDLITNGLEAPSYRSGYAMGQLASKLIDGTQHSYKDLLEVASATDALRVVDGEVDNKYSPDRTRISVEAVQ